jgi:hypothetical protein
MAFGLMKRRRKPAYRALFDVIDAKHRDLTGRELAPTVIVTDFEVIRSSVLYVYPSYSIGAFLTNKLNV